VTCPHSPNAGELAPMTFDTAIAGSGIVAVSVPGNVADQILNQFAKCPDGKPMLPDKVCVIEAKLCAAAGPGAVPNPDIIIHGGDGKACCPANYKPVAGMGWCANGPLPFCDPDKNQGLDKNDHVCKCLGGKPIPPNGVCLDLPRFGGRLTSWAQATASDVMVSSFCCSFCPSFCSALAEPILPSRPTRSASRRAQGLSRSRTCAPARA